VKHVYVCTCIYPQIYKAVVLVFWLFCEFVIMGLCGGCVISVARHCNYHLVRFDTYEASSLRRKSHLRVFYPVKVSAS
jgi:hypothetical protein